MACRNRREARSQKRKRETFANFAENEKPTVSLLSSLLPSGLLTVYTFSGIIGSVGAIITADAEEILLLLK
jgi:hypothetical protein